MVLTCEKWEDYNLMKEENSLTPEQLITYLGDDLLPTVGAAELPLKHLIETALEETKEAIEKEDNAMYSIRKRLVEVDESKLTEEMKKTALEPRYTMSKKRYRRRNQGRQHQWQAEGKAGGQGPEMYPEEDFDGGKSQRAWARWSRPGGDCKRRLRRHS